MKKPGKTIGYNDQSDDEQLIIVGYYQIVNGEVIPIAPNKIELRRIQSKMVDTIKPFLDAQRVEVI